MKRREFITLLGGAAAWPMTARAQQGERIRRIGVLQGGTDRDDPRSQTQIAAFVQALQQLGWTDGRNVRIDYRWPVGVADRARAYATELVALAPDVILVVNSVNLPPVLQATRTVPIVFAGVVDPVGAGFVDSLSRPGGNVTGFMMFEYDLSAKWLELLKEIVPGVTRAAVLRDPAITSGIGQFAVIHPRRPLHGDRRVALHAIVRHRPCASQRAAPIRIRRARLWLGDDGARRSTSVQVEKLGPTRLAQEPAGAAPPAIAGPQW